MNASSKPTEVARTSAVIVADQVARLRAVFPEAVSEGRVDWERLRATLGEAVEAGPERFSFGWAGKRDAVAALQTPSRGTLVPCPEEYEVVSPSGKRFRPSIGTYWRFNQERFAELEKDCRIWWGTSGNNMPALKRFLSEVQQGMVPQTLWAYKDVGHTQEAKKELLDFVHYEQTDNVLDTVKPTRLIRRILQLGTTPSSGDIVLDFFAGSASAAHAVLDQNREDGGNREFILVQLPEPLPTAETTLKTMADVGKERIRRVIARLQQEPAPPGREPEDLGFKVFKLARSSYRLWTLPPNADDKDYVRSLFELADTLVEGWQPLPVIWEVALKEGYGLNCRIEPMPQAQPHTVYRVDDPDREQRFFVCLDADVPADLARQLGLSRDDLFVCRDSALNDTTVANLTLQCRLKTV